MTKINSIKITIGITAYNAENTISDALNSALYQTWNDYEIIIIDDASTDSTVGIIEKHIKENRNIRLIKNDKNAGVGAARNLLIDEARGTYLAFFDDDDMSDPDRLSAQYQRIINYENEYKTDLIACYTARMQLFHDGFKKYEKTMGMSSGLAPNGKEVADRILFGKLSDKNLMGSCAACSLMAKTSTLKTIGKFDGTLRRSEDTDFNLRLALAGGHFIGIDEPLVKQNITFGKDKNLDDEFNNSIIFLEKYRENLEASGWYSFNKSWTEAKYYFRTGKIFKSISRLIYISLNSPVKLLKRICWAFPEMKTRNVFSYQHKHGTQ